MRHLSQSIAWIFIILLGIPMALVSKTTPNSTRSKSPSGQKLPIPGRVVVRFQEGQQPASLHSVASVYLNRIFQKYQVTSMRFPFAYLQKRHLRGVEKLCSIAILHYQSSAVPEEVARALQKDPGIIYAEPLYMYPLQDVPNDPLYSSMHQFQAVQAEEAWSVVKGQDGNVVIAIVDGGTQWDHPDLAANLWVNPGEIPDNGIDDDGNGFVDDVHGWNFANNSNDPKGLDETPESYNHGTHVAGIAAAVTNNGIGVASISWNAKLMPINAAYPVQDRFIGFGYQGIVYAVSNGASIVNCSWGGGGPFSRFEQDVIDFAHENGALVVAAAGNDGLNNDTAPQWPANYRHVLAVGATNNQDDIASFSNFGISVDVFAPGVGINSTLPGNQYSGNAYSGTSMATPLVAGLAALVKTHFPAYSVDQIREQIRVTADDISAINPEYADFLGKGRVNAYRAVTEVNHPAIRIANVRFVDEDGNGILMPGESATVYLTLVNFLTPAHSVSLQVTALENDVLVQTQPIGFSSINTNDSLTTQFSIQVGSSASDGEILHFVVQMSATNYSDKDIFQLVVNPPQVATHHTSVLDVSVTSQGNWGFVDFAGSDGAGFVYNGKNYLFEGGLLIGRGIKQVSDCVRGSDGQTQDNDFAPPKGEVLHFTEPGDVADEQSSIVLVDSLASQPLGLQIIQESFSYNHPDYDDFLILRYTLINPGQVTIDSVYVGLFADWDINPDAVDYARYDASLGFGYAMNKKIGADSLAGIGVLSHPGTTGFIAIDNVSQLYDGFTPIEKWIFLSSGVQTTSLDATDVSLLVSTGPFVLIPHQQVQVGFAVVGGNSEVELKSHFRKAQDLWNAGLVVGIHSSKTQAIPNSFRLLGNFPNPFNSATSIQFVLPRSSQVILRIYDIRGRLVWQHKWAHLTAGKHSILWHGQNGQGKVVASGIYLYSVVSSLGTKIGKMVYIR